MISNQNMCVHIYQLMWLFPRELDKIDKRDTNSFATHYFIWFFLSIIYEILHVCIHLFFYSRQPKYRRIRHKYFWQLISIFFIQSHCYILYILRFTSAIFQSCLIQCFIFCDTEFQVCWSENYLRVPKWLSWNHYFGSYTVATLTWLADTEYLCHKWPRICSICQNHDPLLSSPPPGISDLSCLDSLVYCSQGILNYLTFQSVYF